MTKLNLGCGDRKMHGFINVDVRPDVKPDVVCDITQVSTSFREVDLIYACHVLEHFPWKAFAFQPTTYFEVLEDWYTALREGGVLRLSVPDFDAACEHYIANKDLNTVRAFLYGGQKYDYDFHYHCWTAETLRSDLLKVGFQDVKIYDWRETEHFFVDDYSQAYLPHMDKANGKLMSLNIEAIK